MNKELTRFGIIEYCRGCQHVKTGSGATLCGLTNKAGDFKYTCDNFINKTEKKKEEFVFFGSWKSALVGTIILLLHSAFQILTRKGVDIFMIIGLSAAIVWWIVIIVRGVRKP